MPTVKAMLDTRYKSKDNTHQILIRFRNGKNLRDLGTGYKVQEKDWKGDQVSSKHPDARIINSYIEHVIAEAKQYFAECKLQRKPVRLDLILKERKSYNWNEYLLHRANQYREKEMYMMEKKARRSDREFRVFMTPGLTFDQLLEDEDAGQPLRGNTIYMDDINADLLRDYEAFLVKLGNGNNTRAKKFEFLGNWLQDGIKEGKAPGPNHFREYNIQEKPSKKEKLTEAEVQSIENLELDPGPINNARNLWLFSYYCKGNRFETCISCRRDMIQNGRVHFKMNKGEKYVSVKIHNRLQAIIDQYPGDSTYLFPFIKELPTSRKAYLGIMASKNVIINQDLKAVAALAGIKTNLTFHIARHTFAFHLKKKTDNIHVIKDSLGHSRSHTTEIYLKALDDEHLDKEMDKLYGK